MKNYLVRGILIGGSLGVFASMIVDIGMGRAIAWGMVAGFLAGLTLEKRRDRRGE